MRFRFCGDLDCPDWVLAEINTLSKLVRTIIGDTLNRILSRAKKRLMSSVKMKVLCQLVANALAGDDLDEEKAKKMVADAKLGEEGMEACVSVISTILTSSARYAVDADVLCSELEQLGLPKEHATALAKIYNQHSQAITSRLSSQILRLSSLEEVKCERDDNLNDGPWEQAAARLSLKIKDYIADSANKFTVTMSPPQLATLLAEMRSAKRLMDSISTNEGSK